MSTANKTVKAVRHEKMRIAGQLVDGETGKRVEVYNPYDNTLVGTVPRASRAQVAQCLRDCRQLHADSDALRATANPQQNRTCPGGEKRRDSRPDHRRMWYLEKDSLYEVGRAFDVFSLAGQLCILDDGEIFSCDLTPHGKQRKIFTQREPLNAIAAITPFNHPLNMISHKIAPAIATNNCMVAKPTELTPLTALVLADVIYECGLPPQMLSIVTGLPEDIGDEMITNKHIDLITFTGSVPVGKYIVNTAGYRRTVLELGGNAPLIVMEDADLDKAAELAVTGATKTPGNAAQRLSGYCVSTR